MDKKKNIFLILSLSVVIIVLSLVLLSACEKDDLCSNPSVTPSVVIRFKNKNNKSRPLKVENLRVIGGGMEKEIIKKTNSDSIVLPLKIEEKTTRYLLSKNTKYDKKGNVTEVNNVELTLTYDTEEIFVNKACGYKVVFYNLNLDYQPIDSWATEVELNTNEVKDEKKAHIIIYH